MPYTVTVASPREWCGPGIDPNGNGFPRGHKAWHGASQGSKVGWSFAQTRNAITFVQKSKSRLWRLWLNAKPELFCRRAGYFAITASRLHGGFGGLRKSLERKRGLRRLRLGCSTFRSFRVDGADVGARNMGPSCAVSVASPSVFFFLRRATALKAAARHGTTLRKKREIACPALTLTSGPMNAIFPRNRLGIDCRRREPISVRGLAHPVLVLVPPSVGARILVRSLVQFCLLASGAPGRGRARS